MSEWVDAEKLAEEIYRELLGFATVKWNDHILGIDSEIERQIDVSIRWEFAGKEYLTIVQVKDWKKRPDVNDVGSFATVVQDVRANQGIMVSRTGFSKTAYTLARKKGIQLHSMHDAQSTKWRKKLTIPILWTEWTAELKFGLSGLFDAGDTTDINSVHLIDRFGRKCALTDTFQADWNADRVPRAAGVAHTYTPVGTATVMVQRPDGSTVERSNVEGLQCAYKATRRCHLGQFEPEECRGVIDYLADDSFFASRLPFDQVPKHRDEAWFAVDDPDRIAVDTRGTLVTMDAYGLDPNTTRSKIAGKFLHP